MRPAKFSREADPIDWCAVIAVFFLALAWWRLGIPSKIYFDEVHYVVAARQMLAGMQHNPEHPLLAKQLIAGAIALFGDKPLVWRVPSVLAGTAGLFAWSRFMWFLTGRRGVTLAATVLVATDFAWFIQSRIAMLDMIMAAFAMIALWLTASAVRLPHQGRWRLAGAGIAFGLSLGAKWSVAPLVVLPGLAFLIMRAKSAGQNVFIARQGAPIAGISLIEAGLWLGLLPLLVYWLTFWSGFLLAKGGPNPFDPLGWHAYMLQLQDSVTKQHPYQSLWYQWVGNWRAIWYLYENVDGAQRGIVLIGNPFTMLAGLPALAWCLWAGWRRKQYDALAVAVLYLVTLVMWPLSGKPVQFYYHYLLPGTFLMGCLAMALEALWNQRRFWRWLAPVSLTLSAVMFGYFYPIISAASLHHGKQSFERWMWLKSWR